MKHSQLRVIYTEKILSGPILCSDDSYRFFLKIWDKGLFSIQEHVYIIFLNPGNQVITWKCLNMGTGTETLFDLKFGLALALNVMASKIIIAHNHPSGILKPTTGDILFTDKLSQACTLLDIKLADHLILARGGYFSFMDRYLKV